MRTFWAEGWFSNCVMGTPYLFLSPACAHVLVVVGVRAACLLYRRYWYFGHCPLH